MNNFKISYPLLLDTWKAVWDFALRTLHTLVFMRAVISV
jgi:hypothetical protein